MNKHSERRGSYRIPVEDAVVRVQEHLAPVFDVCAQGIGVLVRDPDDELLISKERVELELGSAGSVSPVVADAIRKDREDGSQLVGVRFESLSAQDEVTLASYLAQHFMQKPVRRGRLGLERRAESEHCDAVLIRYAITKHLVDAQQRLLVEVGDKQKVLSVLAATQEGVEVRCETPEASSHLSSAVRLRCTFHGPQAKYSFVTRACGHRDPCVAVLQWPDRLRSSTTRAHRRAAPHAGLALAVSRVSNSEHLWRKAVTDLSVSGLSFAVDLKSEPVFPGERLRVEVNEGEIWAEALVRSLRPHDGQLLCGIEFLRFAQRAQAEKWKSYVFKSHHPQSYVGEGAVAGAAWDILHSSQYVNETTPDIYDELRQSFDASWRTTRAASPYDRFILTTHNDKPVGTVSTSQIYPKTWLMHHIGVDAASRKQDPRIKYEACRDIYVGVAELLTHIDDFEHLMVFCDSYKPFNHLVYRKFLSGYARASDFVFHENTIYKCNPRQVAPREEHVDGVRIAEASEARLKILAQALGRQLDPVEIAATAFDEERLALTRFSESYRQRGTVREREIIFAQDPAGEMEAAAIMDFGAEGVNIFNLFNICRVYSLDGSDIREKTKRMLLGEAMRRYARRGLCEMLYIEAEPARFDDPDLEPRGADLCRELQFDTPIAGIQWIAHRRMMAAWMEYLTDLFEGMADGLEISRPKAAKRNFAERLKKAAPNATNTDTTVCETSRAALPKNKVGGAS